MKKSPRKLRTVFTLRMPSNALFLILHSDLFKRTIRINFSLLLVLERAVFSPGNWIHFSFIGTVKQGPGNVPVYVLAVRKLTDKSGGSQTHIKLLYAFFSYYTRKMLLLKKI